MLAICRLLCGLLIMLAEMLDAADGERNVSPVLVGIQGCSLNGRVRTEASFDTLLTVLLGTIGHRLRTHWIEPLRSAFPPSGS